MATWDFVVCDGSGNALTNLTRHQGTSLTFTRNGVPECQFSLSHDDAECATILTALAAATGGGTVIQDGSAIGLPVLKAYRTGRDGTKTLRFVGYLATIGEESGTEASTATFTFRGVLGRLLGDGTDQGITLTPTDTLVFSAVDAGQIGKTLMGVAFGIDVTNGTVQASKVRDRTYTVGTNRAQALIDLTNVLDGFDFEITPMGPAYVTQFGIPRYCYGVFNVYASQGSDKPGAKFEYGPGTFANCSAVHRQTVPPVTQVIGYGANGLFSIQNNIPAANARGLWRYTFNDPSISEQQTLDDKANALLRPNPVKTLDFTPDPRLAPSPWDDYWIGDRVQFYANRGALVEGPLSVRVNQITVVIDPDTGLESSEIPNPITPDEESTIRASLQTEVVS